MIPSATIKHLNILRAQRLLCWLMGVLVVHISLHSHPSRTFTILEPLPTQYEIIESDESHPKHIVVRRFESLSTNIRFGNQLIVHTQIHRSIDALQDLIDADDCRFVRQFAPTVYVFETPNALRCLELAEQIGGLSDIVACYPTRKLPLQRHRPYASTPTDPYFTSQWYLENRDPTTADPLGVDLNVRAAWPLSLGSGVTIAIVDDGVDLDHPDLINAALNQSHQNFATRSTNGTPRVSFHAHGTAVAGLALAQGYNSVGMIGSAPSAGLASWVIFDTDDTIVDSLALSDMFLFENNTVPIQNHSWGNGLVEPLGPTLIEQIAISNAVYNARGGKGIVMVRAGGNSRESALGHPGSGDSNDDGYASAPGVIAVGAINDLGRATSYSSPGASLLLAAPGGENDRSLFTTDRVGRLGFNTTSPDQDLSNYGFDRSGFVGTSASAPLVSGICALMLVKNPNLSVRDVQQILLLSSYHVDLDDPDLKANGAGFQVSHNVGFGIPNAAKAVQFTTQWPIRPSMVRKTYLHTEQLAIADDSLSVTISGQDIPVNLERIPAAPGQGLIPDQPSGFFPLVSVGRALTPINEDLTGKGALIQRGETTFKEKLQFAADAGAEFAIVYNNVNGDQRVRMGDTYYSPIPAVFIGQDFGESLVEVVASSPSTKAQLALEATEYSFSVNDSLLCEHVGFRIRSSHRRRGDLRIRLTSPQGTTSILQHVNNDDSPGPVDWTYYSTHHFFEAADGEWKASISDLTLGNIGEVIEVELIIHGILQSDTDRDGLADEWEESHFGHLSENPTGDTDNDGQSNMIEQILGQDPTVSNLTFQLDLSRWNPTMDRVSWPSRQGQRYQIESFSNFEGPASLVDTIDGNDFETEYFHSHEGPSQQFYRVIELQP
jgi:subtilisin family serine protease/subtilisin-like proprotein convertase family protein